MAAAVDVLGEDTARKMEDEWSANSEDSTEDAAIKVAPSLTSAKVGAETSADDDVFSAASGAHVPHEENAWRGKCM